MANASDDFAFAPGNAFALSNIEIIETAVLSRALNLSKFRSPISPYLLESYDSLIFNS